jgi:hypothetical protein
LLREARIAGVITPGRLTPAAPAVHHRDDLLVRQARIASDEAYLLDTQKQTAAQMKTAAPQNEAAVLE